MHQIQKLLLKRLSQQNHRRYADLTRGYDFDDNIVFHLKQLINNDFVTKENNFYSITPLGLKTIYDFDFESLEDISDKRYFVGLLIDDGNSNYLLKSHPAAKDNFHNLPSGFPFFGENMQQALTRIVKHNTGLIVDPSLINFVSLHSKMVKASNGEVLFDEGFAIFKTTLDSVQKSSAKYLENLSWYSLDDIKKLSNRWPELDLCILCPPKPYESYEFVSDYKL